MILLAALNIIGLTIASENKDYLYILFFLLNLTIIIIKTMTDKNNNN